MKRLLICICLLGCSPSLQDLQAKRSEFERQINEVGREVLFLDKFMSDIDGRGKGDNLAVVRMTKGEITSEYLEKQKAKLRLLLSRLEAVEQDIEKAIH